MIQSISSSKVTKTNNYADLKPKSATQISFTGINVSRIGKEVIGDTNSKVGKKIVGLVEEATGSLKRIFRKLKGQDDLPYSEKPITCNMHTDEKMRIELEIKAKTDAEIKSRKEDAEKAIKNAGHNVKDGDIDTYGHPTIQGKEKISNPTRAHEHHEEPDNRTSFRGNAHANTSDEIEKIQNSPWLSPGEKREEIEKIMQGQHYHSLEPSFSGEDEITRIQNSPWLTDDEKAKEIAEIKHNINEEDVSDSDHHVLSSTDDDATSNLPEPTEDMNLFLRGFLILSLIEKMMILLHKY